MSKKRILLVDDSTTSILMEKLILRDYETDVARDGLECIERALKSKPDLILMDLMMPGLDGFQACRRLRDNEATRDVPVIMVTTRSAPDVVNQGFEHGANDYVIKPVDAEDLLQKVRKLLGDKVSHDPV